MAAVNLPEDWGSTLRDIQRQLRELRDRVGNISAFIGQGGLEIGDDGSLKMTDSGGIQRLFIGFSTAYGSSGFKQPVFLLRDAANKLRIALYDPNPDDGYQPVAWIYDHLDHVAFTTDIGGGVAEPWIPVPIFPKAFPSTFLDALGTDLTVPVSACTGGAIWEGWIGKVSHPKIQYGGVFGRVTGVSGTPTYTFKVNGVTVDSFSQTTYATAVRGPFDISSLLTVSTIVVQLTVSATGTGTDRIAAQPAQVYLRQT